MYMYMYVYIYVYIACTKAAKSIGLSIAAATEISDPAKQAGCSHPIISTVSSVMDIASTEVFFNMVSGTSVTKMATICKATAAP